MEDHAREMTCPHFRVFSLSLSLRKGSLKERRTAKLKGLVHLRFCSVRGTLRYLTKGITILWEVSF